jgi:hypothetical protein
MVLFRALGWLLLAMAVGAAVNDGLVWWSEGSLHLLALGELWSRLDFDSLDHAQSAIQRHLSVGLWTRVATPLLRLPALPIFTIAGVLLLWLGRRIGNGPPETGLLGSRPPRRRRARSGLS